MKLFDMDIYKADVPYIPDLFNPRLIAAYHQTTLETDFGIGIPHSHYADFYRATKQPFPGLVIVFQKGQHLQRGQAVPLLARINDLLEQATSTPLQVHGLPSNLSTVTFGAFRELTAKNITTAPDNFKYDDRQQYLFSLVLDQQQYVRTPRSRR